MKNKYIIGLVVVLVVGLGLAYSLSHKKALGDALVQTTPTWFYAGLTAGNPSSTGYSGSKFSVDSNGALIANGITNTGNAVSTGNATRTGNETISGVLTAGTFALNFGTSSATPTTTLPSLTASGHITVGVGQTVQSASTTAVDLNSDVQLQLEQTTPIAGVTCNTSINSSSTAAIVTYASTTAPSLDGFTVKTAGAPTTNPFCYSFSITN